MIQLQICWTISWSVCVHVLALSSLLATSAIIGTLLTGIPGFTFYLGTLIDNTLMQG